MRKPMTGLHVEASGGGSGHGGALCLVVARRGLDWEIRGVDDVRGWWQLQRQDSSASARAWWSEKLTVDRACDLIAAATTLLWLWRWIEHGLDCE
ncbi:hypothetical protein M0R45_018610 [Rubus argutus]|uniref:Uncharacterized protein n=1 Tax=Rubus argutus TaxID=59490 RepID=A0AAW1X5M6_RUBAR